MTPVGPRGVPAQLLIIKLFIASLSDGKILILASFLADLDHSMIWGSSPKMQQL